MSYLAQPTSKTEYGVVLVGNNVNVTDGIISLEQDLSPNANVTFYNANVTNQLTATNANVTGNLLANGNLVITRIQPSAGAGINLSNVVTGGYNASFTVTNTGVLSLANGLGINVSSSTGNITVTNTGVLNLSNGAGINVSNSTGNITVTNTGVLSLVAGPGISISSSTGNVTVSAIGADLLNTTGVTANYTATLSDEYIGVFSANAVTITLPTGVNGRIYYIKDEYGQGSGKITLQPQPGEKVDGANSYIISVPFQCATVIFRAGQWRLI